MKKSKKILTSLSKYQRLIWFGIFLGLDIVLGYQFIKEGDLKLPPPVISFLESKGVEVPNKLRPFFIEQPVVNVDKDEILKPINDQRTENKLEPLENVAQLNHVAQLLLTQFKIDNYEIADKDYEEELVAAFKEVSYEYQNIANLALIGPTSSQEISTKWLNDDNERATLLSNEYTQAGIATAVIELNQMEIGAAVIVLANPAKKIDQQATGSESSRLNTDHVREIPDDEVIAALNSYRASHGVHQLLIDSNLCAYASTRVADLVAYGSLDGHAGFKKDFEDYNNLPAEIKSYPGGRIGENLASQFCVNGTTGQSFSAQTGTALIEWCFDSSVKGHREAQLDPKYNAVCSRHGSNMYVIIFGE